MNFKEYLNECPLNEDEIANRLDFVKRDFKDIFIIENEENLISKIKSDYDFYNLEVKKQSKKFNSVKDISENDYPLLNVSENLLKAVSICLLCKEFLNEFESSKDVKKSLGKVEKFKNSMNIKYVDSWLKDLYYKL